MTKPFLSKLTQSDTQESLSLFKLILRYVNTNEYDLKRDKLLADYIIQKGILNTKLRDEIFVQIINQQYNNTDDLIALKKASHLMSQCLSCFAPTSSLFKYLLKFVSDHSDEDYKSYCQLKMLQMNSNEFARDYPPSYLEWIASSLCSNMALEVHFPNYFDNKTAAKLCELTSWTKGEDLCKTALKTCDLAESETNGWTINLKFDNKNNEFYELNGYDYVFDLITELENSPLLHQQSSNLNHSEITLTNNSSCSTDWYLESPKKFEISIKGMNNDNNNNFQNLNRYNYPITRNDFNCLNKTIRNNDFSSDSLHEFISSIGYTCVPKNYYSNLKMNIKGSSSYVSTSHLKLNNTCTNTNNNQKEFINFLNNKSSKLIYTNNNKLNQALQPVKKSQPPPPPPLPPPPPPLPISRPVTQQQKQAINQLDIKSRAKTIRIGKVRWPPAPNPSITFQYELQK